MFRLPDLVRALYRRAVAPKPTAPIRTRLGLEVFEDRTVPTTVTISTLANITEGDAATDVFRVSRDDTSGDLDVTITPSGSADGMDYTWMWSVTIPNGQSYADVSLTPYDDGDYEGTETITFTVTSGTGYTPGTPAAATANLYDNETPPPPPPTGAVTGRVWVDYDQDGVQDSGEPGAAGVTVEMGSDWTFSTTVSTTTAADGTYTLTAPLSWADGRFTLPGGTTYSFSTSSSVTTTGYPMSPATPTPSTVDMPVYGTPPVISITAANGAESGTPGTVTFTRTGGDLSTGLTVDYTVGGSGTSAINYEALSGSVSFAPGSDTAVVEIVPIADGVNDGDKTVTLSIEPTTTYLLAGNAGSAMATVTLVDDVDPLPVLVHQESFQLSGTGGVLNVSLTVTYTAPTSSGVDGTYTWVYQVQNPTSPTGTTTWTHIDIPVSDMDTDVGGLQGPSGWSGSVNMDSVSWSIGSGGLAPSQTATFSFTTAPREIGTDSVAASDGNVDSTNADAPKPGPTAPVPRGYITFPNVNTSASIVIEIKTKSGQTYTTDSISLAFPSTQAARDAVLSILSDSSWAVAKDGNDAIEIKGVKGTNTVDGVKSLKISVTGTGLQISPPIGKNQFGDVTVTVEYP